MRQDHFSSMITALEASGVSRARIAKTCHISRATVWRLATGMTVVPTEKTVRRLSELHRRTNLVSRRETIDTRALI
jgi:transcriptional regulator with XRE-family HTH domain